MSDADFVQNAKAAWQRVMALQDRPEGDGQVLALAASMWAAMNDDKLIAIAERRA